MGILSLLAALLAAGCSSGASTPSSECVGGQGKASAEAVVKELIASAQNSEVGSLCQLYRNPQDRMQAQESLKALRTLIEGSGGFESLRISEVEQQGGEHVMLISTREGKQIRQVSTVSDDGGKTFFLVPLS